MLVLFAGEVVYSTGKKTLSNNTIGRSGRGTGRHRGQGGMTSSSSATSCNSCTEGRPCNDVTYHGDPDPRQQRLCLSNGTVYILASIHLVSGCRVMAKFCAS